MFQWITNMRAKHLMAQKGMLNTSSHKVNKPRFRLSILWRETRFSQILMLFLAAIASFYAVLKQPELQEIPHLVEDQFCPKPIYAQIDFSFENKQETEKLRELRTKLMPVFYRLPFEKKDFSLFLTQIHKAAEERGLSSNSFSYRKNGISTAAARVVREMPPQTFRALYRIVQDQNLWNQLTEKMYEQILSGLISNHENIPQTTKVRIIDSYDRALEAKAAGILKTPQEAAKEIASDLLMHFPVQEREILMGELSSSLERILSRYTLHEDQQYREEKKAEEISKIRPVKEIIKKGTIILEQGMKVTKEDESILNAYQNAIDLHKDTRSAIDNFRYIITDSFLMLLLLFFSIMYMKHIHPEIITDRINSTFILFAVSAGIFLNTGCGCFFQKFGHEFSLPPQNMFLTLPLAFVPIAVASACGVRAGLYSGLYVSLVAALTNNDSFATIILGFTVSGATSYWVSRQTNYTKHFLAAFISSASSTLLVGLLLALHTDSISMQMPWLVIAPFIAAFTSTIMAHAVLVAADRLANISTNMFFLDYSDTNHELLKKMQLEAPGTYHHSLIVSLLAEAAAQEIGANPLKARAEALFHDVGKLSYPEYFTENSNGIDKHKDLKPQMSAKIILNHVKNGLEFARRYHLKKPIRDAIEQHHGTDFISFFYRRALDSGEKFNESDFRYPGPLPQTKETAILMLADACEAASRSLVNPTPAKHEELVTELIMKRLRTGQLDKANLTFRELAIIRNCFVKTLTSMHHIRVEYPKEQTPNENDLFMDQTARNTAEH